MPQTPQAPSVISDTARLMISGLLQPMRMEGLGPVARRAIYSLRLIAVHERAGRDPVSELAMRLGNVETAAKALALGQAVAATWPENICFSRFCCDLLTHDEATIAALVTGAVQRDRSGFEAAIAGLIRPDRAHILWEAVLSLVAAEAHAL